MGRALPTDAFVLRVVDYRDADRIVTLLTRSLGKVSAIARSARRSRRRFAGSLEPYALVEAEIAPGRSELCTLASARVRRAFPGILSDLGKMVSAGAAMELVRELVPAAEPDERVFDTVTTLLTLLNEADGSHEEHLLVFELRMLAVAGFGPELDRCGGCGRVAHEGQAAQLDAERGSIVCRACGGGALVLSGASRAVMARASRSEWHVTSAPWAPKTLAQVRAATRSLLQHRLGRPLAGGALVAQIRELPGG